MYSKICIVKYLFMYVCVLQKKKYKYKYVMLKPFFKYI